MRGLDPEQLDGIELLYSRSAAFESFLPVILEKEVIVKDVVLEVAKVGRDSGFELIFSGGTSLSQGWGLIERISEDVDFRVIAPEFPSKNSKSKALSRLKAELGHALHGAGFDIDGEIIGRDSNRYIRASVVYDSAFAPRQTALRPFVKVELMGVDRPFGIENRQVQNILERYALEDQSKEQAIPMVSLPDIVSDKVISYLRRTAEHKASPELAYRYDPRLVRHLYDVHRIVEANPSVIGETIPIFAETLAQETQQYGGERFPVFKERPVSVLRDELDLLATDAEAHKNYAVFVDDLVYGSKPSFDEVSQTFRMVATSFLEAAATPTVPEQPQQTIGGFGHGFGRRL